jgi:hypothetical protein
MEPNVATIQCLLCDTCEMPLCSLSDIILDRVDVMDSAVYTYELDLLGEDIWVYSATNPSARRFDVVRVSSSMVNMKTVTCEKQFSTEHTWFPPFAWCMCECSSCGRHLGWGFKSDDAGSAPASTTTPSKRDREGSDDDKCEAAEPQGTTTASSSLTLDTQQEASPANVVVFIGLIVTYCKPAEEYPLEKYYELTENAPARRVQHVKFNLSLRKLFRVLQQIPDQLAANRLAMQLMNMPFPNRLELVERLLTEAFGLLGISPPPENDADAADGDEEMEWGSADDEEGEELEEGDEEASGDNSDVNDVDPAVSQGATAS